MADLLKLKTDLLALESAVLSGKPGDIARSLAVVLTDAADVYDIFNPSGDNTPPAMSAAPGRDECLDACDKVKAACAQAPKQGWGDGTLFQLLLANIPQIIDAIKQLLNKK